MRKLLPILVRLQFGVLIFPLYFFRPKFQISRPNVKFDSRHRLWLFLKTKDSLSLRKTAKPDEFDSIRSASLRKDQERLNPEWFSKKSRNIETYEDSEIMLFFYEDVEKGVLLSKIGSVSKNDRGGQAVQNDNAGALRWTTFKSGTISCPIKNSPMSFDRLVSIKPIKIQEKEMLLAVFTTSSGQLPGSAVCIFSLEDIRRFLKSGKGKMSTYKNQGAVFSRTLFASAETRDTLTTIGVVSEENDLKNQQEVHFLYIGTSSGKLLRAVLIKQPNDPIEFYLVSETEHFKKECQSNDRSINNILFNRSLGRIYTVFADCITYDALHSCSQHKCASACETTNEQVCAWNQKLNTCSEDQTKLTGIKTHQI